MIRLAETSQIPDDAQAVELDTDTGGVGDHPPGWGVNVHVSTLRHFSHLTKTASTPPDRIHKTVISEPEQYICTTGVPLHDEYLSVRVWGWDDDDG